MKNSNHFVGAPISLNGDKEVIEKLSSLFSILGINFPDGKEVYFCPYPCNEVSLEESMCYNCTKDEDSNKDENFQYLFLLHSKYGLVPIGNSLVKPEDYSVSLQYVLDAFLKGDKKSLKTKKIPEFIIGLGKFCAGDLKTYEGFFISEIIYQNDGYFQDIREHSGDCDAYLNSFVSYVFKLSDKVKLFDLLPLCKNVKKVVTVENAVDEGEPLPDPVVEDMMIKHLKGMGEQEMKKLIKDTKERFSLENQFKGPWDNKSMGKWILDYDLLLEKEDFLKKVIRKS